MDNNMEPEINPDTLTALLEAKAGQIAKILELPIGYDGRPFVLPSGPAILCKVERQTGKAAGIGTDAPLRIDGVLRLTVSGLAQDSSIPDIAELLAAQIQKGYGLDYDGALGNGELVFSTPQILQPKSDAGRISIEVSFGFYAIIFPSPL